MCSTCQARAWPPAGSVRMPTGSQRLEDHPDSALRRRASREDWPWTAVPTSTSSFPRRWWRQRCSAIQAEGAVMRSRSSRGAPGRAVADRMLRAVRCRGAAPSLRTRVRTRREAGVGRHRSVRATSPVVSSRWVSRWCGQGPSFSSRPTGLRAAPCAVRVRRWSTKARPVSTVRHSTRGRDGTRAGLPPTASAAGRPGWMRRRAMPKSRTGVAAGAVSAVIAVIGTSRTRRPASAPSQTAPTVGRVASACPRAVKHPFHKVLPGSSRRLRRGLPCIEDPPSRAKEHER